MYCTQFSIKTMQCEKTLKCEKNLANDFANWPVMVMESSSNETSYYLLQLFSSYSGRDDNEEQFILEQDNLNCKIKNDLLYLHNEKEMLRCKEGVNEGIHSYYKLDELVVGKYHNWLLSSNNRHTTVCRFCREEMKNYHYKDHFVRCSGWLSECYASCLIVCKESKQPLIPCKTVLEDLSEAQDNDDDYPINCIAVQASDRW